MLVFRCVVVSISTNVVQFLSGVDMNNASNFSKMKQMLLTSTSYGFYILRFVLMSLGIFSVTSYLLHIPNPMFQKTILEKNIIDLRSEKENSILEAKKNLSTLLNEYVTKNIGTIKNRNIEPEFDKSNDILKQAIEINYQYLQQLQNELQQLDKWINVIQQTQRKNINTNEIKTQ